MHVKFLIKTRDGKMYTPTRKSKIWPNLVRNFRKSGPVYVRVTYAPGLYNDGTFETITPARHFVQECTEKELLEYVENNIDNY
jgi:hypothetical protein